MGVIKFDVSDQDPEESAGKVFEDPKPGVYKGKVHEVTSGFSKGDDGKPDKSRPRLEAVYTITEAGPYKGARLWDYISLTESSKWKLDQFLLAMGVASDKKRTGQFKTEDLAGMPVKIRVAADSSSDGSYRAKVKTVMMGSDADVDDDEDLEELEGDEVVDDGDPDEVEADGEGYTEEALGEMSIRDLGTILTDEFDVAKDDLPKGKDPKIAMIIDLQSNGGESEEDEDETEEETGDDAEDLDALGEAADEEEDADATARLTELAEENDLDPDEYPTWAELATAIQEAQGGEAGDDGLDSMSIADLREKAGELELDTKGTKAVLIARIREELGSDPF